MFSLFDHGAMIFCKGTQSVGSASLMGATDVGQAHKQHAQARSANSNTSILCSYATGNNTAKKDVSTSVSMSAVILKSYENTTHWKMSCLLTNYRLEQLSLSMINLNIMSFVTAKGKANIWIFDRGRR